MTETGGGRPSPGPGFAWVRRLRTSSAGVGAIAYALVFVLVGGFIVWGATVPLTGAIVASGHVAAAGQNIQIQHLEGGIVEQILAEEGDRVKAGQPLFELDDSDQATMLNRLSGQLKSLEARMLMLVAERDGKREVSVPASSPFRDDPGFNDALREQVSEFEARLERHQSELRIIDQRGKALAENENGLTQRKDALERQLVVVSEEMNRKKDLLDQGLTNRDEYTTLLRSEAELLGQIGSLEAQIAATRIEKLEAIEQIERAITQRVEEASTRISELRPRIDDVSEQLRLAEKVLERTTIRSPVDGVVVQRLINASGMVVQPGQTVLEILPVNDELIIEAQVKPTDIDNIFVGQPARLRFSALNTRVTPDFAGTVSYISADRLVSSDGQLSFYLARLRIDPGVIEDENLARVAPGMPVESFIVTEDRTFFEYLSKPILDSLNRAFREQ